MTRQMLPAGRNCRVPPRKARVPEVRSIVTLGEVFSCNLIVVPGFYLEYTMRALGLALIVGLTGLLPPAVAVAAAPKLQPHLGVYELRLIEARGDVGVEAVRGRLVIEITDSCDGYTQTQRMLLRIVNAQGNEITSDSNHTTWESRDGTTIRFNSKNEINGEVSDVFAGRAQLEGKGLSGVITFAKPDDPDLPLAAGTIFPTEHFFELIDAGLAGEAVLNRTLYDGSGPHGIYDTVARLTPGAGGAEMERHDLLRDVDSWRVRLAYFTPDDRAGVPEYEVGFRLFENGVATELFLDYGDFTLGGTLARLDYLPSDC